jgi:hypothetical protein
VIQAADAMESSPAIWKPDLCGSASLLLWLFFFFFLSVRGAARARARAGRPNRNQEVRPSRRPLSDAGSVQEVNWC